MLLHLLLHGHLLRHLLLHIGLLHLGLLLGTEELVLHLWLKLVLLLLRPHGTIVDCAQVLLLHELLLLKWLQLGHDHRLVHHDVCFLDRK